MLQYDELVKIPGAKRVKKGTVMIKEGDTTPGVMYMLLFGEAGSYRSYGSSDELLTETFEQGDFFGEPIVYLNEPVSATITALSDVIVLPLNKYNTLEVFARFPAVAMEIISELCKRVGSLSASNEKLIDIVSGNPSLAVKQHAAEPSRKISLFPQGHGSYTLNLTNNDEEYLYNQKCVCPLCENSFTALSIITSKLRRESAEGDSRVRYRDIEPMYYEIITCPSCYYSSVDDKFADASKRGAPKINEIIAPYKDQIGIIKTGRDRDTFSVFAGYYLAMLCAPVFFDNPQITTASLWQKLSRVYEDCGDNNMYLYATQKSLDDYKYAYGNYFVSEKASQQMCMIIGDLCQRLENLDEARSFYYIAKANKGGTPFVTRQADIKLEEIRELLSARGEQV